MYLYPDNLKSRATLWFWQLRDLAIVGGSSMLSIFIVAQTGIPIPLALSAAYAFLSIRCGDVSILDYVRYAVLFLFGRQEYEWSLAPMEEEPGEN